HIDLTKAANIKENNTIVVRHILGKVQVILPVNYNINLHVAYTVNIYVSTFIGDVEVIYR
ncbi:transporter, partial [Staphylococcus aureus]|uniref:LiaF domain-containing protein n=1 Tax=Staphylococcus aureus TaxID=1280 RepID=UPI0020A7CCF6